MKRGAVRLYQQEFQAFLDTYEVLAENNALQGNVQLVLKDPPYNIRRESRRKNAEYDHVTHKDCEEFVDFVAEVLRPGGHAIVFCIAQQFDTWYNLFSATNPRRTDRKQGRNNCALSNSVESAIHLKKNGRHIIEESAMVNYKAFGYVPSEYSPFCNVINNVLGLAIGEKSMVPIAKELGAAEIENGDGVDQEVIFEQAKGTKATGSWSSLRPEQKCVSLLQELISRFSQPN